MVSESAQEAIRVIFTMNHNGQEAAGLKGQNAPIRLLSIIQNGREAVWKWMGPASQKAAHPCCFLTFPKSRDTLPDLCNSLYLFALV